MEHNDPVALLRAVRSIGCEYGDSAVPSSLIVPLWWAAWRNLDDPKFIKAWLELGITHADYEAFASELVPLPSAYEGIAMEAQVCLGQWAAVLFGDRSTVARMFKNAGDDVETLPLPRHMLTATKNFRELARDWPTEDVILAGSLVAA
jgi:hypothetical protein